MGREAIATCEWRGEVAEVKALLEAREIIVRGDIRLKLERASINAITVDDADLVLTVAGERLVLTLGTKEAVKWHAQLLKPLPTLRQKLGVGPTSKALVIGKINDAELANALEGAVAENGRAASVLIAVLHNEAELNAAITLAETMPERHLWCVYGKGKFATITDSAIRSAMRARGFADSKSCGISEHLTATRYRGKSGS